MGSLHVDLDTLQLGMKEMQSEIYIKSKQSISRKVLPACHPIKHYRNN